VIPEDGAGEADLVIPEDGAGEADLVIPEDGPGGADLVIPEDGAGEADLVISEDGAGEADLVRRNLPRERCLQSAGGSGHEGSDHVGEEEGRCRASEVLDEGGGRVVQA